jgi:hypothetical protein
MAKRIMHYLWLIVGALALFTLLLAWQEPRLLYYPERQLAGRPDLFGFAYEDVWLTVADGVKIHGWFVPSTMNQHPVTILFLHGNAGNISHRFEKLNILHDLGADSLIIDYRGFGRSEGKPNERGTYIDADAAYLHLTKTLKREPRTVVVYGESLGSAVAVDLASRVPVGGVIIEEAFTSVPDVAQGMYPFLPVRWLVRNRYDSIGKIGRINAPLLILHSRDDELFSYRHAERLFAAAREPKRLVELRGSHNDAFFTSAGTYRDALATFVRERRGT